MSSNEITHGELLSKYINELKTFDWYYEYSDSMAVIYKERIKERELINIADKVDPDRLIWNMYDPRYRNKA